MGKKADDHERPEAAGKQADGPAPDRGSGARNDETIRVLERMNKELLARVKELQLQQIGVGEQYEGEREDAEKGIDLAVVLKDMHGEIDAAYVLKKALEDELVATQKALSRAEAFGAQAETRANLLEEKAILADQLRKDISFVEEEQHRTFRRLEEVTSELEQAARDRDRFAEAKTIRDMRIKQLQKQGYELEAEVSELKERLVEMVSFFSEKSKSSPREEQSDPAREGGTE